MKDSSLYSRYSSEYGKIPALFILFMRLMNRLFNNVYISYFKYFSRVNSNTIVFLSTPDYADNSRALSEYLAKNFAGKFTLYWCVDNLNIFSKRYPDEKVIFVQKRNKYGELKFGTIPIVMRAKYIMATHAFFVNKSQSNDDQVYIRLWHGCGYKDKSEIDNKKFRVFDYALVSGPLFVKTKTHYWNVEESRILPLGYPRYDWLLKKTDKAIDYYNRIRGNSKKVIIWMPTFRNALNKKMSNFDGPSVFPLMSGGRSWELLNEVCEKNSVYILVKRHQFQLDYNINFDSLKNISLISDSDFDREDIPMYQFLAVTDGLITDYSSVAFDYLIVNKPIAFALDDYEYYKEKRGFVFDDPRNYMPGHHLYKIEDLCTFVNDVAEGNDFYVGERKRISEMAIHHSENYCKEIADAIFS